MRRAVLRWVLAPLAALMVVVLMAAAPQAAAVAADCWRLDGKALERAQAQGWCRDAFASDPAVAVPVPAAKPPPPRKEIRRTPAKTAPPRPPPADTDFAGAFRRDLNAVAELLGDMLAGKPLRATPGWTPLPPHQ